MGVRRGFSRLGTFSASSGAEDINQKEDVQEFETGPI
jgi:hypothetical protein